MSDFALLPFAPRARMMERVARMTARREEDREILGALLALCLGWMQAAEAAEAILTRFGGIEEALNADPRELIDMPELGEVGAAALRAVRDAAEQLERRRRRACTLASDAALIAHLQASVPTGGAGWRVLFLDASGIVLGEDTLPADGEQPAGPMIRNALKLDADALVVARRCEGEVPSASPQDLALASHLNQAAQVMGLHLRDMVLLGRDGHVSLRRAGVA